MYLNKQDLLANRIVISIPIGLKTREEIALALLNKYGTNYLLLDNIFQDRATNKYCLIDISDRTSHNCEAKIKSSFNTNIACLFAILGQDKISETTLHKIDNYQQIVYLISNDVGYDSCLEIAKFTEVFLSIGGMAVQVESAGIAHDRNKWLANYNSDDIFNIYSLFVALVEGDNYYYSCGMHNFGKADVMLDLTEDINLAIYVLNVFNYYRLTEFPILLEGQTFQPDLTSPIYQIKWTKSSRSEVDDSLLFNPYGRWHLITVNSDQGRK